MYNHDNDETTAFRSSLPEAGRRSRSGENFSGAIVHLSPREDKCINPACEGYSIL